MMIYIFPRSTKQQNSALISSDSVPDVFANDVILSNKCSPSFKSDVVYTESLSLKSNGSSKVSPTGSAGSNKYYAMEDDYLIVNCSNGNT